MGTGCCDLGCWMQGALTEDHLYGGIKVNCVFFLFISSFLFFIFELISHYSFNVSSPIISLCCLLAFPFPLCLFWWMLSHYCVWVSYFIYSSVKVSPLSLSITFTPQNNFHRHSLKVIAFLLSFPVSFPAEFQLHMPSTHILL